jgi:MFS family permease
MKKQLITLNNFFFFFIVMLIVVIANNNVLNSPVLPQIRAGEWMIDNGKLLKRDIFSYTMENREWVNVNWLTQLFYGVFYKFFGLRGVVTITAITIAGAFSLLFSYLGKMKANIFIVFPIFLIGAYVSGMQWMASVFTVNFLLVVLYFTAIDRYNKQGYKFIYFLPIIQILWVNMNADYIYAYLIFAVYIIGLFINKMVGLDSEDMVSKEEYDKRLKITIIMFFPVFIYGVYQSFWL